MKTYEFPYFGDGWSDTITAKASEDEIESMKEALRNAFETLEDESDLDSLRERIMSKIRKSMENADELGIQIGFPEELYDEVGEE
jgi:hypothetical protein